MQGQNGDERERMNTTDDTTTPVRPVRLRQLKALPVSGTVPPPTRTDRDSSISAVALTWPSNISPKPAKYLGADTSVSSLPGIPDVATHITEAAISSVKCTSPHSQEPRENKLPAAYDSLEERSDQEDNPVMTTGQELRPEQESNGGAGTPKAQSWDRMPTEQQLREFYERTRCARARSHQSVVEKNTRRSIGPQIAAPGLPALRGSFSMEINRHGQGESFGEAKFLILPQCTHTEGREGFCNVHLMRYIVENVWHLPRPEVIISVTGGAQHFDLAAADKDKILRGIMEGTRHLNPWFITGGTHSGIMKYVGEARAKYNPAAPLIGISSLGAIAGGVNLRDMCKTSTRARAVQDSAGAPAASSASGQAHRIRYKEAWEWVPDHLYK